MSSVIVQGDARQLKVSDLGGPFGVIVADPPWLYRVDKGQGAAIDQYNLLSVDEIAALPVGEISARDAVLFLWGTWPLVPEAIRVLHGWGFEYVTGFPWVKLASENGGLSYGIGYWVRGCSEYILIGRKGNVSPPRLEGFLGLLSPNLQHSRKPASVHEIAEGLPGPYLELFARRARDGWTCFGNEVEEEPPMFSMMEPVQLEMEV